MLKTAIVYCAVVLFSFFSLAGCVTKTTKPTIRDVQNLNEDPHPPGYPAGDSIDWRTVPEEYRPLPAQQDDRELPGKRLGLIGPILAEGGSGSKAYLAVYDSAGVLVGVITKREANKDPEALRLLLEESLKRSEHQNRYSLEMMRKNGVLDR